MHKKSKVNVYYNPVCYW